MSEPARIDAPPSERPAADAPHCPDSPRMIERPCPLCGGDDWNVHLRAGDTTFGFPGTFTVAQCVDCGMRYTRPQVAQNDIAAFYPDDYSAHTPDRARRHVDRRPGRDPWDALPPRAGARLLDVGCGSGAYLLRQQRRGWAVAGIEPAPAAADAARQLGLDPIWNTNIDAAPPVVAEYDMITLLGVLDHIPEPLIALKKLHTACADGGRCIVTVPNAGGAAAARFGASWPGWDLPRHQNHFTPQTLREMLRRAGFDRIRITGKRRTSHWRHAARNHADATNDRWSRLIASSRNVAGLFARFYAHGKSADEIVAIAERT